MKMRRLHVNIFERRVFEQIMCKKDKKKSLKIKINI